MRQTQIVMNAYVHVLNEIECFGQEVFHLFLKVGIEFSFELFYGNFGTETTMVDFFVIFFDGESEDCFLESLALKSVQL